MHGNEALLRTNGVAGNYEEDEIETVYNHRGHESRSFTVMNVVEDDTRSPIWAGNILSIVLNKY